MKKRKEKEYLICVIDTISKKIRIKAKSEKEADKKGISGDWFDKDVEDEEVIDRQYEGVEYCEDE
jgi:hypothetical protein